jgi:uncharacterized phage protein gp47/JayE
MPSQPEIVSGMRKHLQIIEPDLDTSTGSVTRKILDVVGEAISGAYIDQHLLTYSYDIDSKTEGDLDAFVQLFGLSRIPARRATGTVTFSRSGVADKIISIPVGLQLHNGGDPSVSIQTITPAVMQVGELSVNVPVQAISAGPDGNIPPGTLYMLQPLDNIATVINAAALTGGETQETDSELRERWKLTVFRNMAGTEAMYLGVALNDPDCTAANVLGVAKRRREQLQIVTSQAVSTLTQSQYNYTGNQIVGKNLEAGDIALPGVDYTWNTSVNPPRVDVLSAVALPDGTLIDLEFQYVSKASRNDAANKITNRVDVWCAGTRVVEATQTVVFRNTITFNNTALHQYLRTSYLRPDGTNPTLSNVFIPLAWGPIITVPSTIVIGGTTYGLATAANPLGTITGGVTYAYQIVHNDTQFGYAPGSLFGLEWNAANLPANNTIFSMEYTFNGVPHAVQNEINRWRLVTTDAVAHQAKNVFLKFNLAVIYDFNVDQTVVNTAVDTAISDFLSKLGIATVVQASDILQTVHNVPGVDAVRFLHSGDVTSWNPATPNVFTVGIQKVIGTTVVQSYVDANGRVKDVFFADNEVPVFGLTFRSVRAQNSYGTT